MRSYEESLAPRTGLSEKKNVHAQVADILGILVDCTKGTLRPKNKAMGKRLPRSYWQCIQSLTNLYSTVMHGMRPFVAALTSLTKRTHASRPMHATAGARFAMEMWRAVLAVAIRDPDSVAIPIEQYIGATTSEPFVIVSDASPTGMCAALYHTVTGALTAWAEYKFPYGRDVPGKPGIPRPLILTHCTNCPHTGPNNHTRIHVDQRQCRRATVGGHTKVLIHGQPLCQPRSNATPYHRAPPNGTTGSQTGYRNGRHRHHEPPGRPRKPDNAERTEALSDTHTNYYAQLTARTIAETIAATRPTLNPPEHE
jgi:hypothetical protein